MREQNKTEDEAKQVLLVKEPTKQFTTPEDIGAEFATIDTLYWRRLMRY